MKDQIENTDFDAMSKEEAEVFLNEMLNLDDAALKESVLALVDKTPSASDEEELPASYEVIFNNDKIKEVTDVILSEYDEE